MRAVGGPDVAFFVEPLTLIVCPIGLLLFAISLVFFLCRGKRMVTGA